jgi:hypothetical protein
MDAPTFVILRSYRPLAVCNTELGVSAKTLLPKRVRK